jgi:uncharacterized membrane protein YfcA
MPEQFYLIALMLFVVAFLYASVGHGGASGYIAVFTLFNIAAKDYKPLVLVLNIIIASIAFIQYYRAGYFRWRLAYPFLLASVPAAFLGSYLAVHNKLYNIFLGIALIIPIIRFLGFGVKEKSNFDAEKLKNQLPLMLLIGVVIGFISGLLNIGGGIFLSPVIIFLSWAGMKEAAATSALFIVFNSIAGLLGNTTNQYNFDEKSYLFLFVAVAGGLFGSFLGSKKLSPIVIQRLLAVVLIIASLKLIIT